MSWRIFWCLFFIIILLLVAFCVVVQVFDFILEIARVLGICKPKKSTVDISYYWNLENKILNLCFDDRTKIFNWNIWFDRRDEIIHTAPANVLKDIDSNFEYFGRLQIYKINAIIESHILGTSPYNPVPGIQRLKREIVDTGILLNLSSMYSSVNAHIDSSKCPETVLRYQKMLHKIIYSNGFLEKSQFNAIVSLGRQITN